MLSRRNNAINKSYIKNGEILWIIFSYKLYFILFWASISQFDDDDDILFSRQTALSDMRLIAHNKHLLCPAKNGGLWLIIWFCCLPSRFNAQTFCHNSIFLCEVNICVSSYDIWAIFTYTLLSWNRNMQILHHLNQILRNLLSTYFLWDNQHLQRLLA